jgi:hypothetical protein
MLIGEFHNAIYSVYLCTKMMRQSYLFFRIFALSKIKRTL